MLRTRQRRARPSWDCRGGGPWRLLDVGGRSTWPAFPWAPWISLRCSSGAAWRTSWRLRGPSLSP
eukprot:3519224-Alexandrium_andersonii.AAC.1